MIFFIFALAFALAACEQDDPSPFGAFPKPPLWLGVVYGYVTDPGGAPAQALVELEPDPVACPDPDANPAFLADSGFFTSAATDSSGRYRVPVLADTSIRVVCFEVVAAPVAGPEDTVVVGGGRLKMTRSLDSVRVDVQLR